MAERRMFAKSIIGSARFLRMPPSSRLLYYDLGMYADDDGVVEAFSVMRQTGATEDDLRVLVSKGFVRVLNDDLVSYIMDWSVNNSIRKDRYHPSIYKDLVLQLTDGIPSDNQMATNGKPRLGKDSIGKDSKGKSNITPSQVREEFDELWEIYPKKRGKKRAYAIYESARIKSKVEFEAVKSGMESYIRWFNGQNKDIQFMKDGDTFFSQWSWQDDWSASGRTNTEFAKEADDILAGIL